MAKKKKEGYELVVITKAGAGLRARGTEVASTEGMDVSPLADLLKEEKVSMQPLFGSSEERIIADQEASARGLGETPADDLSRYYQVDAPVSKMEKIAKKLLESEAVEAAYVKPPAELASAAEVEEEIHINDMEPDAEGAPATPSFVSRQIYLNPAPAGIDAYYAWTIPGGRGNGVKIIDCEWGVNFSHEDLVQNSMGVMVGTNSSNDNHGTAVVGVIGGDRNTIGITGICPDAQVGLACFSMPSATAIRQAADKLRAGDILLLEIHRAGPRFNFQGRADQRGYIAIEWWPDDFAAIRYAVNKGIIVVEAAGNGAENFDDPLYNVRPAGFPSGWRNPFNPANPSSQAVVVGAGAPPPGTHGRNHGPDRSRLGFSNYGRRVDCQGWGREVTTTGYGNLQGGSKNVWYTDTFSGTSSASPIVVGTLGCLQGILRNQGAPLLTPARAIQVLRATGSPQQDAPGRPATQRIGNRPNLRQLIPMVANTWINNKRVVRCHAKYPSKQAWVIVEGSGWLRIKADSTDGVTNMFLMFCEAQANNRRVNLYVQNGQVTQATLR